MYREKGRSWTAGRVGKKQGSQNLGAVARSEKAFVADPSRGFSSPIERVWSRMRCFPFSKKGLTECRASQRCDGRRASAFHLWCRGMEGSTEMRGRVSVESLIEGRKVLESLSWKDGRDPYGYLGTLGSFTYSYLTYNVT